MKKHLLFVAALLASLATVAVWQLVPSRSLQQGPAKDIRTQRQEYLDTLLAGTSIPYCDRVVYDHDGRALSNYYHTALVQLSAANPRERYVFPNEISIKSQKNNVNTADLLDFVGKGSNTSIFITPRLFNDIGQGKYGSNEVRHMIIAREGAFIRHYAQGFSYFPPSRVREELAKKQLNPVLMYEIIGLHADGYALSSIMDGTWSVSANYSNEVARQYGHRYTELMKDAISSPLTRVGHEFLTLTVLDLKTNAHLEHFRTGK